MKRNGEIVIAKQSGVNPNGNEFRQSHIIMPIDISKDRFHFQYKRTKKCLWLQEAFDEKTAFSLIRIAIAHLYARDSAGLCNIFRN